MWKNESVICGDWEHNSGRGGRAALDEGALFTPDDTKLPCIRGAVGMRRMSKKHSTLNEVSFWSAANDRRTYPQITRFVVPSCNWGSSLM